jgi:hypothetical protein
MADPLKFILDLDAKLGNLPSLDQVLGKIADKLSKVDPGMKNTLRAFNALQTGANVAGKGLGGLRSGLNSAGGHVGDFVRDALAHFTALATFAGFSNLVNGAISLGKSLITTVASAERADAVLSALVGPDKAKLIDQMANKISAGTEFDDDALKRFASGLLRVGFAFNKLPTAWALGADIAAITDGDPAQTLAEVGAALERLQKKGGLDTKILSAAGLGEKEFFGPLGKKLGISSKDAEARAAIPGAINSDVLLAQLVESVQKKTGKAPGAVGQQRGLGLSAALSRLQSVPDNIFKSFKGTQAGADLAVGFNNLATTLGPDGPVGKKIVAGLGGVFTQLSGWVARADFDKITAQVMGFIDSAGQVLDVVVPVFKFIGAVFDAVGTAIGSVLAELFLEFESLINVGTKIGDFFGNVVTALTDAEEKFLLWAGNLGSKIWEGLKGGLSKGVASMGGVIGELFGKGLLGPTEEVLEIQSPSRVFERYGALTGQGFAKGLAGTTKDLEATVGATYGLAAPSADLSLGGGVGAGSSGPITITAPVTVNYTGTGGPEAAQQIATVVQELLPGQLQYAFERLRVELGTA